MPTFPKQAPSIGRSIGLTGPAGLASGGLSGWYDVTQTPYSADPTGAADATTAINSLLTFLKTHGGTGYFPPGTYTVSGVLNGDSNTVGYTLRGSGGSNNLASKINFTGTGAVNGLTLNSTLGVEVCHLNFAYTALTGNLVQSDGGVHGVDSQYSSLHHCNFSGPTTPTCNALLMINKTNVWDINNNNFQFGGTYGLQMGPDYVVACTIGPNNIFAHNATAAIGLISDDCEACTIEGNTFEELGSPLPTPVGIQGSATVFTGGGAALVNVHITGNWFGDVSASTVWIYKLATWSGVKTCSITHNYFGGLSGGDACCYLRGAWLSMGNVFDGAPGFDTDSYPNLTLTTIGDSHIGQPTLFPSSSRPGTYVNLPMDANMGNAALPYSPPTPSQVSGTSPNPIANLGTPQLPVFYYTAVTKTATLHPSTDGASFTWPVGTVIQLLNAGTGTLTVATSATPPNLTSTGGLVIAAGAMGHLLQTSLDNWILTVT